MSSLRILRCGGLGLLLTLMTAMQAANAAYPDRPLRFVVPAAAGGGADTTVRILTQALSQRLGQPIVVDNKPGAAGSIGLDAIAKSAPDGYTIGTNNLSNFTVASLVAKKLPYSPARDFTPIAMVATQPYLLGVTPGLPVKSVKELVSHAKANPGKIFYGSSGNGSSLHVLTELFRATVGIEATHVPYKSIVAAEMDLMAGQIHMLIDNFSTMAPNVEGGKVRALATTGPKRTAQLPNVPTLAELGIAGVEAVAWSGVVGPANLPAEVVKKLNAEINAVLADPKVQKQFADIASDVSPMSPSEFTQYMKAQDAKWGAVVRRGNITAD
jgi:tripartite-type tricarboxylate transporter receptor subunit TctC